MDKLFIVWSTDEIDVAKKMVLLYSSVILPRGYWDKAHLMIWGPSAKLLAENIELQEILSKVQETSVEVSCCVVCSDEYDVTAKLASMGINMIHTGELLTSALKEDWKVITF